MTSEVDIKGLSRYDENGIIRPEKLALIHVTNYLPQKNGEQYEIKSTAEATDYLYPRNTIHFTIGHHVDFIPMSGNWDEKGIMIVAPLKDTMDENGIPMGMSSHDTFFETTPGRNLRLPKGTQLFIPAADPEKLAGELSQTEGNITYYKTTGYTQEEKKQIFKEFLSCEYESGYRDTILLNGNELTQEQFINSPDSVTTLILKKVLISRHLRDKGFIPNTDNFRFNSNSGKGAKAVAELGKSLKCLCYSSDEELHYRNDFTREDVIGKMYGFMKFSDILLHPDNYEIVSSRGKSSGENEECREYQYRKKSDGSKSTIWFPFTSRQDDYLDWLKNPYDFTGWMEQTMEMSNYLWTPAFRETYETWMKKTVEHINRFRDEAKGVDLDARCQEIRKSMQEFDRTKGGLLTRAFALGAKTPERQEKAQGLLNLLRDRDYFARETRLSAYRKRKNGMEQ